ncbi:low temperature requirement protein A [Micromonospora sp. NPDC000207]|uniref:low temperature requirement protein A n=1 Tax=Micromonospora sp. NPDC000207 TaxID=3154246 RepID=UPI0033195004
MVDGGGPAAAGPGNPGLLRGRVHAGDDGTGVTRVELFFDLFFVYAFLEVSRLMAADFSLTGLYQGTLLVLLLWRAWTSCTWLGNTVRMDQGIMTPVVCGLCVVVLLMAVTVPTAFTDEPGLLTGPLVVAVGFTLVRGTAQLLFGVVIRRTERERVSFGRLWTPLVCASLFLLAGALVPPRLPEGVDPDLVRLVLVTAAVTSDFATLRAVNGRSRRIHSVRHWTDRHALIILVALGETIISVGTSLGLEGTARITAPVIAASMLGMVVVAILWWSYFDVAKPVAERALHDAGPVEQTLTGRDAYSLWHLPMISGLILLAMGLKQSVRTTAAEDVHPWQGIGALVLFGGVLLYLVGLVGFQRRVLRIWGRGPLLGAATTLVVLPLAALTPPLGSLALLTLTMTVMVVADQTLFRQRHRVLHELADESLAGEAGATPKELFVDLVFVFVLIQVVVLMGREGTWHGMFRALLVLGLVWWAWCTYSSVTNSVRSEASFLRITLLTVLAVALVLGIALPQTFTTVPGGLPGSVVVAVCYVAIRLLLVALLRWRGGTDPRMFRRTVGTMLVAGALLGGAAVVGDRPDTTVTAAIVTALWAGALATEMVGNYRPGPVSWQMSSIEHWTERFELIMLIAFGQVIVAIGLSADWQGLSAGVLTAVALSALGLAALWWAYFDTDVIVTQRSMRRRKGGDRAALARDAYVYLHFPMVCGLLVYAFGLRANLMVLSSDPYDSTLLGHVALYGGVAIFLVANQLFWWRSCRQVSWYRVGWVTTVLGLALVTYPLPELVDLAVLSLTGLLFAVVETFTWRQRRLLRAHPATTAG